MALPASPPLLTVRVSPLGLFYSNRLGCLGSLLVSLVVTAILLLVTGVIDL